MADCHFLRTFATVLDVDEDATYCDCLPSLPPGGGDLLLSGDCQMAGAGGEY